LKLNLVHGNYYKKMSSRKNSNIYDVQLLVYTRVSKPFVKGPHKPDFLRNVIVSGYVAFYQINKFFVNVILLHY